MTVATRYLTKREAAEYCRCSVRTLDRAVASDELRAYGRARGLRLFLPEDLDGWIRRRAEGRE